MRKYRQPPSGAALLPATVLSLLVRLIIKESFDNIHLQELSSFNELTEWLYQKRCWHPSEVVWSNSRDSPKDRARKAAYRFWHLAQHQLYQMFRSEMHHNNIVLETLAAEGSIPMCGPFAAQGADLLTLWKVKLLGKQMRN